VSEIRKATVDDIPVIKVMLRMLREESPEYSNVPIDEEFVTENLHALVTRDDVVFLFDVGRGFMFGYIGRSFHDPRVVAHEELVYILPVHRGMGQAIHLIKAWEEAVRAKGATKIFVGCTTGINNHGVSLLYKRLGYSNADRIYLSKNLEN
jgi:GNAT superfamily N-acetyltransferase